MTLPFYWDAVNQGDGRFGSLMDLKGFEDWLKPMAP